MNTVRFSIQSKNGLEDINICMSEEEQRCTEFMDAKIAYQNGEVVTLVTFRLYDDTSVPKELILKKKGSPAPKNATQFWEGIMMANNQATVVVAYRAV